MLQAINSNKAGRNISSNEMHWRQLFKASEDSLTSTIIGLLFYLPLELAWHILSESCYDRTLPQPTRILSKEFWPVWDSSGTKNSRLVEPDVFIRTPAFDLIIEAKRYDYDQQSRSQWETEFQAYLNEFRDDDKPVYLLALGGIHAEATIVLQHQERSIPVFMCRWERLLINCRKALAQLQQSKNILHTSSSAINVLEDLLLGFSIHGYMTADWFEDTAFSDLSIRPSSIRTLEEASTVTRSTQTFRDLSSIQLNNNHIEQLYKQWI